MEAVRLPYPIVEELFTDGICHYYRSVTEKGEQVIVKEIFCETEEVFRKYIQEGLRTAEMRHDGIVRMLGMVPVKAGEHWKIFSVFEHIECRLAQEMSTRREGGPEKVSEIELRIFLRTIAEVLYFAKSKVRLR